jgi:hypothetical protein
MILEVKVLHNETLFGLYENDTVMVKDDPELLKDCLVLFQQGVDFLSRRIEQLQPV